MKIKKGFISNSSSSTFIIGLKKMPQNVDDLREEIFPRYRPEEFLDEVNDFDYPFISIGEMSDIIFRNIKDIRPLTKSAVFDIVFSPYSLEVESSSFYQGKDIYKITEQEERKGVLKEYDKINSQIDRRYAEIRWLEIKDLYCYELTYSDKSGPSQSYMEHGDIFRYVPHIYINCH